jgi:serine/threonine protein kinase/tetratricopeptide (TPR) repeat protein
MTSAPGLTASDVRRLSRLLDQALDVDPDARRAWLDTLAASDSDLRPSLEKALFGAAGVETLDFAERMAEAEDGVIAMSVAAGEIVGPYRLIRELGSGGTASVWLAERADGLLQRQIALKLPHLGMIDRGLAERIARERNILAGLEHPNIARLYDTGVDAKGRPFLAIEYVDGLSPDQYCQKHSLGVRESLTLFVEIARAVAYAHARLVVHRDLKPSNVLVTDSGEVRLLDFGIARLLHGESNGRDNVTRAGARMLTPGYAAPEQFTGGTITVATDVYSLGVILYELLTGRSPYSPRRQSLSGIEEAVISAEVPPASKLVDKRKARALRGDVDTILARALQKNPLDRYGSVESFAADVQRFLDGQPIVARPPSFWYVARKFVRRNALTLAAVSTVGVCMLAALIVALWQWNVASRERAFAVERLTRAQAVSDFSTEVITDGINKGEALTIEQLLARSERIAAEAGEFDPTMRAVAASLVANWYMRYDLAAKADELLKRTIESLPAGSGGLRSDLVCMRARASERIGRDVALIVADLKAEIATIRNDPMVAAGCLRTLGYITGLSGDSQGRLQYALEALRQFERVEGQSSVSRARVIAEVAMAYARVGQPDRGIGLLDESIHLLESAGMGSSNSMAVSRGNFSVVWMQAGHPLNALRESDAARAIEQKRNPGEQASDIFLVNRGLYLERLGRPDEAARSFQQALELSTKKGNLSNVALADTGLARLAIDSGRLPEAESLLQQAERHLRLGKVRPGTPPSDRYKAASARLALAQGRLDEARATLDELISDSVAANSDLGRRAIAISERAELSLQQGRIEAADKDALQAFQLAERVRGTLSHSYYSGATLVVLGHVRMAQRRFAEAAQCFERAQPHLRETLGESNGDVGKSRELAELARRKIPG